MRRVLFQKTLNNRRLISEFHTGTQRIYLLPRAALFDHGAPVLLSLVRFK